jgi:hypothetical protein
MSSNKMIKIIANTATVPAKQTCHKSNIVGFKDKSIA